MSYQNLQVPGVNPLDNENDLYITPVDVVKATLDLLPDSFHPLHVLDPGAGTGRWGDGVVEKYQPRHAREKGVWMYGVDIDPTRTCPSSYDFWYTGDFRDWNLSAGFDLVVGNPPYGVTGGKRDRKLAEKFIRKGWGVLNPGGYMLYLLKTVFLEGENRFSSLFQEIKPEAVYVSARRIPFRPETNGNRTNTVSYAAFLWRKPGDWEVNSPFPPRLGWYDWLGGKLKTL